jgi:hypothetical protein
MSGPVEFPVKCLAKYPASCQGRTEPDRLESLAIFFWGRIFCKYPARIIRPGETLTVSFCLVFPHKILTNMYKCNLYTTSSNISVSHILTSNTSKHNVRDVLSGASRQDDTFWDCLGFAHAMAVTSYIPHGANAS